MCARWQRCVCCRRGAAPVKQPYLLSTLPCPTACTNPPLPLLQDRRILKAAATSKRSKGSAATTATTAATGAKDAKTFQAGVGGQADAASLLLEGLLLKVGLACVGDGAAVG